jgi:hypothetical protein
MPMIVLMLVKKAVYYVLAAGPFLLLGMIAINSRYAVHDWDFVEYGPETTARIEAYIEPVKASRAAFHDGRAKSSEAVRSAVGAWLEAGRHGALHDIPPASALDEGTSVIYGQILDAKQELVEASLLEANRLASSGRWDAAATLYVDVVELGNIAKYSEFESLTRASTLQIEALAGLASVTARLDSDTRQALASRLGRQAPAPDKAVTHMVDRFAMAYGQDLRRSGKSTVRLEAARHQQRTASTEDPMAAKFEGWQELTATDRSLYSLYGRSRVAYVHHLRFKKQFEITLGVLSRASSS